MSKSDSLNIIRKLMFYMLDLNLYLDNFPTCSKATEDFEAISDKCNNLIYEYEKSYGPLLNFGLSYIQNPEAWINTPWPWEKSKDGE